MAFYAFENYRAQRLNSFLLALSSGERFWVPARDAAENYFVFHVADGDIMVRVREGSTAEVKASMFIECSSNCNVSTVCLFSAPF